MPAQIAVLRRMHSALGAVFRCVGPLATTLGLGFGLGLHAGPVWAASPPHPAADLAPDRDSRSSAGVATSARRPLTFKGKAGPKTFNLEVADTPVRQSRGLMFRRHLEADGGMLFVFADDLVRQFWMKNTWVALDLIFIDADGRVVGIVADAEPQTLRDRGVAAPSRYVVELVAGAAARAGIEVGTQSDAGGAVAAPKTSASPNRR